MQTAKFSRAGITGAITALMLAASAHAQEEQSWAVQPRASARTGR